MRKLTILLLLLCFIPSLALADPYPLIARDTSSAWQSTLDLTGTVYYTSSTDRFTITPYLYGAEATFSGVLGADHGGVAGQWSANGVLAGGGSLLIPYEEWDGVNTNTIIGDIAIFYEMLVTNFNVNDKIISGTDLDTYMQFGKDWLRLYSGGNIALGTDASGYVGIGKTVPTTALDVLGTATATAFSGSASGLTGVGPTHDIADHNDTTATGSELETLTDASMADALHSHSFLAASDGSPANAISANAYGQVLIENTLAGNVTIRRDTTTGGAATFELQGKNTNGDYIRGMYFQGAVSDRTPGAEYGKAAMYTTYNGSQSFPLWIADMSVKSQIWNPSAYDLDFVIAGDTDTSLFFLDASTDRIGIGTSSPGEKLVVIGTEPTYGGIASFRGITGGPGYHRVIIDNGSGTGDAQLSFQNSGSSKWSLGNDTGTNDFIIRKGAGAFGTTDYFMIDSVDGYVGIGTVSPDSALNVVGSSSSGQIARFIGTDWAGTYHRTVVDSGMENEDAQMVFQDKGASKWSMGNDGSTDAFAIKRGVGNFASTDPIVIDTSDNTTMNGTTSVEALSLMGQSADPSDPAAGNSVMWTSDGTGAGDAGDIMVKINIGGTVKTATLVDYSAIP